MTQREMTEGERQFFAKIAEREERNYKIMELARDRYQSNNNVQIDDCALTEVSEGDPVHQNGAWVPAKVRVDLSGSPLDKDRVED